MTVFFRQFFIPILHTLLFLLSMTGYFFAFIEFNKRIISILSVNLNDDEKRWFVDYYRKLCRYGASKNKQQSQDTQDSPTTPRAPVSTD